jgi:ABC-type histidine transport system ATPase subunit
MTRPMTTTSLAAARSTLEDWQHMTASDRLAYLAVLSLAQRRQLAEALAEATAQRVDLIVRSWVYFKYLSGPQASAVLALNLEESTRG